MDSSTVETLQLFIEKADKLWNSAFTQHIVEAGTLSLKIHGDSTSWSVARTGPQGEEIDAFILTLRFFVQDNERISIHEMSQLVDPALSPEWRTGVAETRGGLNAYLDSPPRPLTIVIGGHTIASTREILDVFLYGSLAHADESKRRIFRDWESDKFTYTALEFQFANALMAILQAVRNIAVLCRRELSAVSGKLPSE